jgi:hypothetical protein
MGHRQSKGRKSTQEENQLEKQQENPEITKRVVGQLCIDEASGILHFQKASSPALFQWEQGDDGSNLDVVLDLLLQLVPESFCTAYLKDMSLNIQSNEGKKRKDGVALISYFIRIDPSVGLGRVKLKLLSVGLKHFLYLIATCEQHGNFKFNPELSMMDFDLSSATKKTFRAFSEAEVTIFENQNDVKKIHEFILSVENEREYSRLVSELLSTKIKKSEVFDVVDNIMSKRQFETNSSVRAITKLPQFKAFVESTEETYNDRLTSFSDASMYYTNNNVDLDTSLSQPTVQDSAS